MFAEAKKVLLIIMLNRKNLVNIYFLHTFTDIRYYKTSFVNRPQELDTKYRLVAYVNVCRK